MKKFNAKKVTGKAAVGKILIPVGCAFLGSIAGAAAGKTANLAVAAALGVGAIAFDEPNLTYAAVGAAVVTPSKSTATAGLDGLDGISDTLAAAKNRALGQAKSLLSNAKLDVIADKLPVSGIEGLGSVDSYEQGYLEGANDAVDEMVADGGVESLSGFYNGGASMLAPGVAGRQSVEAMKMAQLLKA